MSKENLRFDNNYMSEENFRFDNNYMSEENLRFDNNYMSEENLRFDNNYMILIYGTFYIALRLMASTYHITLNTAVRMLFKNNLENFNCILKLGCVDITYALLTCITKHSS
jgi:hypothetical protein